MRIITGVLFALLLAAPASADTSFGKTEVPEFTAGLMQRLDGYVALCKAQLAEQHLAETGNQIDVYRYLLETCFSEQLEAHHEGVRAVITFGPPIPK